MKKQKNSNHFTLKMQKKLAVLFFVILLLFVFLSVRLIGINRDNGESYKRQVLSQQEYDSITLPAKRGEIVDRNGTKIAVSQKVYNVVIDSKTLNSENGAYLEPTLTALFSTGMTFIYTREELRNYIAENPGSQYRVVAKKQKYDLVKPLMDAINDPEKYPSLKGVWLEEDYKREYPYNSLACDVIGFVQGDNEGAYGLEEFYNSTLNGVNGREYGYLNDDENLERTIKPAEDGRTLETSLDVNIQSIVEKHILAFNEEHKNEAREGAGSNNTGVIVMDPNTGEILAMASSPGFDLNNPRDESLISVDLPSKEEMQNQESDTEESVEDEETEADGTENAEDENSEEPGDDEEASGSQVKTSGKTYEEMYEEAKMEAFNSLWKNFCINSTYEPGSTIKPFTMAAGLEEGILSGNESYVCNGVLTVGDHEIHCSNRLGHGPLTFSGALENSCNVAFMKMGAAIGKKTLMKYHTIFNFGLKTNVDLTGEALTNSLVFDVNNMTPTDLAVASFGQGFNVTMIQVISGFCSLINGGNYYRPHLVTRIVDSQGATIENINPRLLKQTISADTSEEIRQLCVNVVTEGTGKSARPAGYMIGGKTGTAEKLPRGTENYVVSFIGFAPADNPRIAIYTVIDTPNVAQQASARYATILTKDILTEVLPYMNIFPTEELTEEESAELEAKQQEFSAGSQNADTETTEETENNDEDNSETKNVGVIEIVDDENGGEEEETQREIQFDPETGYAIDPTTGDLLDPETGMPIDSTISNIDF